jgi:DNA-binding winged helix-turn-helix (wHTH) protein/tetratricopeptide (TPR) repeat protein
MPGSIYQFGSFRLDVRERRLACDGRVIPLRGKVFDTLCALVKHPGRLLRKDELMKAIWPDSVVEENNLEHNLSVLRSIFRRNGGRNFIETVPRQGYRFVAEVRAVDNDEVVPLLTLEPERSFFVAERDSQLQQLKQTLEQARSGARQTIFLTGEAGIGKTTLVRKFLADVEGARAALWVAQGECLDQRWSGEAYMPVLEAFARLCRQPEGSAAVEVLRRRAPTWLWQMPSVIGPEERAPLQQSLIGLTPERMLREGVDALQAMAAERLVILVLEDLHWSDGATLDFLSRMARGQEPASLLLIGTYRPAEAKNRSQSVSQLVQQLRLRGCCQELPLSFLSEDGIADYLRSRLQGSVPSDLAHLLHQRTEGNPLFVATLLNSWMADGSLREDSGRWVVAEVARETAFEAPESLRHAIEEQVEQLPPAEREIVEAASVTGVEFSAPAVAAALSQPSEQVEPLCAALARSAQFFAACGKAEWPDGTVCERYRFIHSLYREVTYQRLPAGLRGRWHQQIGGRLEQAFAGQEDQIAAELAEHFRQARVARRAVHYLRKAAQQCMERGAPVEAVFHLTSALEMLRRIPEQPERTRLELGIDALLAPALSASKGFGDHDTEAAFRRAYELARQLGEEERQFPIIFGFAVMLELRGEYRKAQELMEKYLPQQELRGGYMLEGLDLLACSRFHQGAFADALKHGERGAKAYCPQTHSLLSGSFGENPGIDCNAWMALSLWFLGHPDEALARAQHAVALAEDNAHAYGRATAWAQLAFLHQLRREKKVTRLWARRTIQLAAEQGSPYRQAVGNVLHGWALAQCGRVEQGIAELRGGIAGCCAAGAELDRPYHLALLAEAYMLAKDRRNATATLREAIEQIESTRSFFYEAELWRLRGHVRWNFAQDRVAAGECFERALHVARAQQARSLELRAAISMTRLLRGQRGGGKSAELLAPLYHSFAGAGETPDLRDARVELEALKKATSRGQKAGGLKVPGANRTAMPAAD